MAGDFALGALGGVLNVAALGCLYQGLAVGRAGVWSRPIAAVVGAVIPVVWGLASGENPANAALVGVAAGGRRRRSDLGRASRAPGRRRRAVGRRSCSRSLAGVGFGFSFVCYGNTRDASEFWPVLSGRIGAVTAVVLVAAVLRISPALPRTARVQAVAAGLLDVGATALLLVAVRNGLFATVAPVAALAPAFTVGHAWWYLRERPSTIQIAGTRDRPDRTRADRGQRLELTRTEGRHRCPRRSPSPTVPCVSPSSVSGRSPSWCCPPTSSATTS